MEAKVLTTRPNSEGITVQVGFFDGDEQKQVSTYYLKDGEEFEDILPKVKKDMADLESRLAKHVEFAKREGETLDLSGVELPAEFLKEETLEE